MNTRGRLVRYREEQAAQLNSLLSPRRKHGRRYLRHRCRKSLLISIILFLIVILTGKRARKVYMDVLSGIRYRLDSSLSGRLDPGPSCKCEGRRSDRNIVLSYMRTEEYLPLVDQLQCSLRRSNPGLRLALMVVKSISPRMVEKLRSRNIKLIFVEDLQFPNLYEPRFRYNWLKIRAFELEEYDSILLVDSDTVIVQDISELFSLPTCFAAVADQANMLSQEKHLRPELQGGVLFIRPCKATAQHMLELLKARPKLQFVMGNAEQEFLTWYFRYEGWILPPAYNTMVEPALIDGRTYGLVPAKILHFTKHKPFRGRHLGSPGHEFLCTNEEMHVESYSRK
jgi:hypothetical protein